MKIFTQALDSVSVPFGFSSEFVQSRPLSLDFANYSNSGSP